MMLIIVTLFPEYMTLGSPGNIELASGVTLTTGDTENHYIYGVISGDGSITKQVLDGYI